MFGIKTAAVARAAFGSRALVYHQMGNVFSSLPEMAKVIRMVAPLLLAAVRCKRWAKPP